MFYPVQLEAFFKSSSAILFTSHDCSFFLVSGFLFVVVFRSAISKYHKLGGIKNRRLLSYSLGGRKSKIKVSTALVPFKEGPLPCFSLWLVHGHPLPCLFTSVSLCACLYVQISFSLLGPQPLDFRPHKLPHFNLITSVEVLSPDKI